MARSIFLTNGTESFTGNSTMMKLHVFHSLVYKSVPPYTRPSILCCFWVGKWQFLEVEFFLFLLFCYVLASLSMGISIFMSVHPYIRPSVGILVHRKPNVEIDMQGLTNISRDIQMETRKEHQVHQLHRHPLYNWLWWYLMTLPSKTAMFVVQK